MGFASLGALFALALAAVPVLIHWSRRREVPERPLPTASLLRAALRHRRRRRRLVDVLLLLVRMGLVVSLVLLLARPYVERKTLLALDRPLALALVLDDSASMHFEDVSPSRFEAARAHALALLERLPHGSEVALVLGGVPARIQFERLDPEDAAASLRSLDPRPPRGTDLATALRLARQAAGRAGLQRRVTVVLGDLSQHATQGLTPTRLAPEERLRWVRLGPAPGDPLPPNRSVARVQALSQPHEGGVSLRFDVWVARHGTAPDASLQIELWDPEREMRLAGTRLDVPTRGARWRGEVELPSAPRFVEARLEPSDPLKADDRRAALVRRLGETPLLLVDGDPHPHYVDDEVGLLRRVLEALGPRAPGWRVVDAAGLRPEDVERAQVVWLADPPPDALSSEAVAAIGRLLERGGSLLLSPGDRSDPMRLERWFGRWLPARPGPPLEAQLEGLHDAEGRPIPGWRHTRTWRRMPLEDPLPRAEPWLRFPDGTPALLARPSGHGGFVVLGALPIDDDWSDWTLRPGFVARWGRWWQTIERSGRRDQERTVGEPLQLPSDTHALRLEPAAPSMLARASGPEEDEPLRLPAPGPWLLHGAGPEPLRIVATLPPEESDPSPAEDPAVEAAAPSRRAGPAEAAVHVHREPAHGPLLLGLLALLLLEGLLREPGPRFPWPWSRRPARHAPREAERP